MPVAISFASYLASAPSRGKVAHVALEGCHSPPLLYNVPCRAEPPTPCFYPGVVIGEATSAASTGVGSAVDTSSTPYPRNHAARRTRSHHSLFPILYPSSLHPPDRSFGSGTSEWNCYLEWNFSSTILLFELYPFFSHVIQLEIKKNLWTLICYFFFFLVFGLNCGFEAEVACTK